MNTMTIHARSILGQGNGSDGWNVFGVETKSPVLTLEVGNVQA